MPISLAKSLDFFDPALAKGRIHIIGCGSVGATIAENLVRFGLTKITLWDFDKVEAHNIHNQIFRSKDIGKLKVESCADILREINPDIGEDLQLKPDGWDGNRLAGYIFLAVDSIELRRKIAESNVNNPNILAMFDVRNLLTQTQLYAADWSNYKQKTDFVGSMQFSHDEVGENEKVSACGITLGVAVTSRVAAAYTAANFIHLLKGEDIYKLMLIDIFNPENGIVAIK